MDCAMGRHRRARLNNDQAGGSIAAAEEAVVREKCCFAHSLRFFVSALVLSHCHPLHGGLLRICCARKRQAGTFWAMVSCPVGSQRISPLVVKDPCTHHGTRRTGLDSNEVLIKKMTE